MDGIDFSNNLNPYGPPPGVCALTLSHQSLLAEYGPADAQLLKRAVSGSLAIPEETLGIGLGATQVLFALPKMLRSKRSVVPKPTFWEYEVASGRAGIPVIDLPLAEADSFSLDLKALDATLQPGDALYIPNISNPTSRLSDKHVLLELVSRHPETDFVIDETYLMFHHDFRAQTLSDEVVKHANLHVVLSLSKFYTIPGARVGVLVSHPEFIRIYEEKAFIPYSLSPLSLFAAIEAVQDEGFATETRERMKVERDRVVSLLREQFADALAIVSPDGNFVLARIINGRMDEEIAQHLAVAGIIIRKGSILPGLTHEWIRFCIRTPEENERFLVELKRALGQG